MRLGLCAALLVFATSAMAAPVLRLSESAVVVQVAVGANPLEQLIYATNIGDGTLAPSVSISPGSPWLTGATVQTGGPCTATYKSVPCFTIQFTFSTASLARGTYTATVTVSDPNAIDAPQTVTVTMIAGSRPPYVVDQYLPPGAAVNIGISPGYSTSCTPSFISACLPRLSSSTQDGGQWLSVFVYNATTIASFWTAYVHLAPAATMPSSTYYGTVTISGTSDDHAIPVTMHVTTQPIAVPSTAQISLRLAQGGPAMTAPFLPPISLSNSGMGTLAITGVSGQGTGVSAVGSNGAAVVTVDPSSLAPGVYNDGLVTMQCNAANCPVQVPVSLEVIPQEPPISFYQGVADNATFYSGYGVAPGDIAVVAGEQLSLSMPVAASRFPLPTTLGGATVLVNDVEAPLYYSSYGQIAFQVPSSTVAGTAIVQVVRGGQPGNRVTVNVKQIAPQIVVITDVAYNIRDATHPTTAGEPLILWCIGLGPTNPAAADGMPAPAAPLATVISVPKVFGFGSVDLTPSFAGLAPGEAGVYQVIVTVPSDAQSGTAFVSLLSLLGQVSNTIPVTVQ